MVNLCKFTLVSCVTQTLLVRAGLVQNPLLEAAAIAAGQPTSQWECALELLCCMEVIGAFWVGQNYRGGSSEEGFGFQGLSMNSKGSFMHLQAIVVGRESPVSLTKLLGKWLRKCNGNLGLNLEGAAVRPDTVVYNAFLKCCAVSAANGSLPVSPLEVRVLRNMRVLEVHPDAVSFNTALRLAQTWMEAFVLLEVATISTTAF
eukprot:2696475-Amphidinium_carterae.1